MDKIKYGIIGASGKMGKEIESVFNEAGHELAFTYDVDGEKSLSRPEVLIDFSLPIVFDKTIEIVKRFNVPLIIGTTGLNAKQLDILKSVSENIAVVQSFNFSIGIQLLLKCIDSINENLDGWDIEIEETHHRFKKDKPSGTALMLKNAFNKEIPVSSLRIGNVFGTHTIHLGSLGETIKLEHNATSRRTFADGVLRSAEFIVKKKNGFFSFTDVINNLNE